MPLQSLPERRIKQGGFWLGLACVVFALGLSNCSGGKSQSRSQDPIGLFTALPLLWQDGGDLGAELRPGSKPHWAAQVMDEHGGIVPLDTLSGVGGGKLAGLHWLVIAQPRILSPADNVALDDWVRGGGHLLLIIDPAYTEESAFPIGDPRRPPDQAMLSPILARWGLELKFDADQPLAAGTADVMGIEVPTILPGYFAAPARGNCRTWSRGLAVACAIGKGRVLALADAALLERDDPDGVGKHAFSALLDSAFLVR
ncbi:MAG: ABC transporter [Novosphingobium sp.]